jgi:hypothetical protein
MFPAQVGTGFGLLTITTLDPVALSTLYDWTNLI